MSSASVKPSISITRARTSPCACRSAPTIEATAFGLLNDCSVWPPILVSFFYRGVGTVRRRLRRRAFTSARTAPRSLDLPLAIANPHLVPAALILCLSVDSGQCTLATVAAFLMTGP